MEQMVCDKCGLLMSGRFGDAVCKGVAFRNAHKRMDVNTAGSSKPDRLFALSVLFNFGIASTWKLKKIVKTEVD